MLSSEGRKSTANWQVGLLECDIALILVISHFVCLLFLQDTVLPVMHTISLRLIRKD